MTTKIAISLPDEQVAKAREAVARGRAASLSAYMSQALARQTRDDELEELLTEMKAAHGEPSAEDYVWARQALGLA